MAVPYEDMAQKPRKIMVRFANGDMVQIKTRIIHSDFISGKTKKGNEIYINKNLVASIEYID